MKRMKPACQISLGFAALVILACLLGGAAGFNLRGVREQATRQENVPEVAAANSVERASLLTMYDIRGYAFSENEEMLKSGRGHLADVKKHLEDAKKLGGTSPASPRSRPPPRRPR